MLIALLLFAVALFFAIRTPTVQTWLTQMVASYMSGKLGAKVEVGRVEIDLWARVVLKDIYVEDQHKDTLAFIPQLALRNYHYNKENGDFAIQNAEINGLYFNLVRHKGDKYLNYKFILDYINSSENDTSSTESGKITFDNLKIKNSRFNYINENRTRIDYYGIDWNYLQTRNINLDVKKLLFQGNNVWADIGHLGFKEISGFILDDLSANLELINGNVALHNAKLITPESSIKGQLNFLFNSIDDFDNFEGLVEMRHDLDSSIVQMSDLAYFASFFEGYNKRVNLSGNFKGTVANLKGKDVVITVDKNTRFSGNFEMEGLPDIDNTFITMNINELTSNKTELERIQLPPYTSTQYIQLPDNFEQLGQITYKGNFTGFINNFVSYGNIYTAIGSISTDLTLKKEVAIDDYSYYGQLGTENFNLGKFYNTPSLGPFSCDMIVEGSGTSINNVNARLNGDIPNIFLNGYNYTNITADGVFQLKQFSGDIVIDDPNVNLDFGGVINFKPKNPILDFKANLYHANLKELKILEQYDLHSLSVNIKTRSEGLSLEKFVGEIKLEELTYCAGNNEYQLDYLTLISTRGDVPQISILSDIAEANIHGDFSVADIIPSLSEVVSILYPRFEAISHDQHTQNYKLNIKLFDVSQITEVFLPDLNIAAHTSLMVTLNEPASYFEMTLLSDSIRYAKDFASGIIMDIRKVDESFYLTAISDILSTSFGFDFDNLAVDARTEADTIYTAFAWGSETSQHGGDINGEITIFDYDKFGIQFNQSSISAKNQYWHFKPNSNILIDSTDIAIHDFEIYSSNQTICADGYISNDPVKWLNLDIQNFDISNINPFIGGNTKLYGIINGSAGVRDVYHNTIFTNDLSLNRFKLNEYFVGDLALNSTWDNNTSRLKIDGKIVKNELLGNSSLQNTPVSFSGYYSPKNEDSPLDILANIDDLDLSFINTFMEPGIVSFEGFASGNLSVKGKLEEPLLNANTTLRDASVFVDYLNTKFYLKRNIGIYPDMFTFDNVEVTDAEGNIGNLVGQIMHNNFEKWSFDLFVEMENKPLLVMNTNEQNNSLYYGKAYSTGTVNISGYDSNLNFECYLKTEKGTTLAMPMSNNGDDSFESFVRFVNTSEPVAEKELNLSGITLKMDIEVTPDAEFKIIFDEGVGDVMSGRAKGSLNLQIDNLAAFNMYGTLEVTKGDYLFTLKNLINKKFSVRQGGTINWYGDPMAAELNLSAIYKVSASLSDIVQESQFQSGQRVPVELEMKLRGQMFNPEIEFDILLPTVDQMTRSRVNAGISNEQEKNKQAFALLALNRFIPPPNVTAAHGVNIGTAAGTASTSDLLSNQISNWLGQISNDFNLGFKYNVGDEISNREIALALSTQLFDEKLSLSTNVGVSRNTASNTAGTTNLIGDIRIEYKLTQEGKIRFVVYNESNDYRMAAIQQSPYTQGIGIIYRTEFDTLDEFFKGFKGIIRKKRNGSEMEN